ncbi:MAG TPA: FtsW/RodA/SpoVE family cell cycle protein [bacterium]|nr:FtsW/RodA/SpoVE family cell cycle protein [bacterium]HPN34763.1 FtsW/RodA/SpoVE family cell cycle protein [bacterium]
MGKARKIDLAHADYTLLVCVLFLVVLGLATIWSATSYRADQIFGDSSKYLRDQLLRVVIGLLLLVVVARTDYRTWLGLAYSFYGFSVLVLAYLLTHGPFVVTQYGASSWLQVGPILFQPSDFARYALILLLARLLVKYRDKLDNLIHGYLMIFAFVLAMVGLIVLEHDMGGAALTMLVALVMFYFAEVPVSVLAATVLTMGTGALSFIMINPYMRKRLGMFIGTAFNHQEGLNYQLKQSLLALAHGGFWGQGAGGGHAKYNFLPMAHNDFIFSMIGEEYGLIGTIGVLTLFVIIVQRGIRIARHAPDGYGRLLAGGVTVCIGSYAIINAAVVTGLLPTTGIPMPFLSYGGTAIVAHLIGVGLLLNVSSQADPAYARAVGWKTYQARLSRSAFQPGSYLSRRPDRIIH